MRRHVSKVPSAQGTLEMCHHNCAFANPHELARGDVEFGRCQGRSDQANAGREGRTDFKTVGGVTSNNSSDLMATVDLPPPTVVLSATSQATFSELDLIFSCMSEVQS
jgi:hypothetical protein